MFTISNLSVSYGRKSVLKNLSLEIPEQSITGIAGYNGAGKTTLLNAMYGLFRCAKDCLKHNGTPVTMKEIAFLEAETYFYSGITGRDWLSFFMRKNRKFDYEKWSSLFSLPLDEAVADYSLGMKKKLALLAVLSLDRKFIILDEPFNSLDLESVTMLEIILKNLYPSGRFDYRSVSERAVRQSVRLDTRGGFCQMRRYSGFLVYYQRCACCRRWLAE